MTKEFHVIVWFIVQSTEPNCQPTSERSVEGVVFYRLATFWFGWEEWLRIENLQPFTG